MSLPAPPRRSIGEILVPRRVAVFGASDDRGKWGGRIMHYLALHGFDGEVVPINPRRAVVQGRTCYAAIDAAPPIDVAVIAVPAAAVLPTLRDCAAAGVGAAVVISSGFAEIGAEGAAAQAEMTALAQATGMRVVGPNCLGLINFRNGMSLTSARVLDVERIIPGSIGLVSQSGALMLSVYNRAHDQGVGFSQIVSVGNQADLDLCDFFAHMIAAEDTEAICLHVEGIADGRRFRDLLHRAQAAGKPVVVLKTGRSAGGEAAARSHTASLAGAYPVFAAVCRQAGALLVDDPDVMVLAARLAQRFRTRRPGGIGVISSSGGLNGITADRLADVGLGMAAFTPDTRAALSAVMLPTHLENPVDLGARRQELGEGFTVAEPAARAVINDANVGVVLVPMTTAPNYEGTVGALIDGLESGGKPYVFVVTPGSVATGVRALLRERGVVSCDRLDDGIRLLRAWQAWTDAEPPAPAPHLAGLPALAAGYQTEPAAKTLLAACGIAVPRERVTTTEAGAVAAAAAIGFPVVMKGVSARIVHKSDGGLVRLGLANAAAVAAAFAAIGAKLALAGEPAPTFLVAEMLTGGQELIVGARHDPQFGPVVLVGAGGVLVDLLDDVAVAPAPLGQSQALGMLRGLRLWPLLAGYRGRPALDVDAAAAVLVQVGALAAQLGERLRELDINPLLVRPAGQGAVALDARAVIG